MNKSIDDKELEVLLQAARAAGDAEGYARAKFELALERAKGALTTVSAAHSIDAGDSHPIRTEKQETLLFEAKKAEENEAYKTRVTVLMTKTIALDYVKSAAPRIVGPSEIIKNTEKNLDLFISFGTLQRAMAKLVQEGEIEAIERSRWKYKGRADAVALKSVR